MLSRMTRVLPYFIVLWMAKRYATRIDAGDCHHAAIIYDGEVVLWRAA